MFVTIMDVPSVSLYKWGKIIFPKGKFGVYHWDLIHSNIHVHDTWEIFISKIMTFV